MGRGGTVPAEGKAGRGGCSELRESSESGGASAALRRVGAAPGAERCEPPGPAGGVARTRARRRDGWRRRALSRVLSLEPEVPLDGVLSRECRRSRRSGLPSAGDRAPEEASSQSLVFVMQTN